MHHEDGKTLIKFTVGVIMVLGIIGYSLYQARNIIIGPKIALASPVSGSTVTDPIVHVMGNVTNISFISLNDRQIFVDNKGAFDEEMLLSPGYNVWKLQAEDKFGRIVSRTIELVLKKN